MINLERDMAMVNERARLRVINAFAIDITSISRQSDLAWYVAREVVGNLGFEDCVVYFCDDDENVLRQVAAIGPKNPFSDVIVNPLIIPIGSGITGTVAKTREMILDNDLSNNDIYIPDIDAALSELCVPLKVGEKLYGVLDCEHAQANHFTLEDGELLTAIASLTSARLHLIEQSNHLQMVQELKFREDRFRDFVDIASDWYWELDENLRYSYISAKSEKEQQYKTTHFLGKLRSEVKPDGMETEKWLAHLEDLKARRPFRDFVQCRLRNDGARIWQSLTGKPWFDSRGKFMGYRGITTDITRHYEAEQKLRQSEARFRAMFNSSSVAINLASDRAGNIIYWNRAAELTFGYKEAEVLGQPISLLMPERYRHAHQKGFKHALATEEYRVIGKTVELVGLRKNGEEFEIELSLSTWDQGPDKYFSAVIHDISERKRFERELIENRKRAEAASLAKSEFLASMSHELRTPLTSSLGSLGLLKGLGSHDLSEQNRDLIEIAIRNNEALLRLVNELLDFEKYQTGHLSFEMRRLDLRQLTQDTVSDNQGFAQTNSVLFSCQTTPESCYALIDPHRFVQVLVNLLSNAAKFSEEHSLIEVTVEKRNGSVVVSVKDRGPGIPDEFRSQVFEPFSQADGSSTRKHGGTGLGLSISKAMTEGMNGTLNFKARKDSGTTFFMTFSAIDIPEQDAADC